MVVKGPLTSEQKRALIASYYRHNRDVARAAAEVGVTLRTAYLWIGRFEECGESGLAARSHARKGAYPPTKVTSSVAARIAELRREDPGPSARRIAERLRAEGTAAIGKSSAHAALRRAGLSGRVAPIQPVPRPASISASGGAVDVDSLVEDIRCGIELDVRDQPRDAIRVLGGAVWGSLPPGRGGDIDRLLRDETVGRLLLRSALQLGHSLMNAGRWSQAATSLRLVRDWIVAREAIRDRYDRQDMAVSLRRDDIAVECWEYLAIVLRETSRAEARESLDVAIAYMERPHRGLAPTYPRRVLGTLYRSRAKLRLRISKGRDRGIEDDLRTGERYLEETDDPGWHAARDLTWAQLHHYRSLALLATDPSGATRERAAMEHALAQMLELTNTLSSPILRAKFFTDAARLFVAHGMDGDMDGERIREAAAHCIRYGYAGQAEHLLAIRRVERWLPENTVDALRTTARPA